MCEISEIWRYGNVKRSLITITIITIITTIIIIIIIIAIIIQIIDIITIIIILTITIIITIMMTISITKQNKTTRKNYGKLQQIPINIKVQMHFKDSANMSMQNKYMKKLSN